MPQRCEAIALEPECPPKGQWEPGASEQGRRQQASAQRVQLLLGTLGHWDEP